MSELRIRAFIAAMLPKVIRDALVQMGLDLARQTGRAEGVLRWARPEGLHLTFHFEASLPQAKLAEVGPAMGKAASQHQPFDLRVSGLGTFPDGKRPRIIWAGVEGELDALENLARSVEREMAAIGLTPDKPFKPHLTLARVRQGANDSDLALIAEVVRAKRNASPVDARFRIEELTLVQSTLHTGGSIYSPLGTARLRGGKE